MLHVNENSMYIAPMKKDWIDITTGIKSGMVHWPGDTEVIINKPTSMLKGDDANVTNLQMSAHTGTHIDAPLHFIKEGKDVSQIDLDRMIGIIRVISIKDPNKITVEELQSHSINEGERIFFKTQNSDHDWSMEPFMENYIYLSTPAAKYLLEKKVKTIGIDYLSIAGEENGLEVHQLLLKHEILIIEGLRLGNVTPGYYDMICLPLLLFGSDGAPARVVICKHE